VSGDVLFYRCSEAAIAGALPEGYTFEVWRPGLRPPGAKGKNYVACWAFHRLHVFRNQEYSAIVVRRSGDLAHISYVFPGFFRFPFMSGSDVQVGDTWTAEEHRGKGIATWALMFARETLATEGRRIWYVSQEDNVGSIRAAEKAGFTLVGRGSRKPRLGVMMLGYYDLEEPLE